MTNVSYERGITVLSFPDISFVILLFVFFFYRFEIKSGFPFFKLTVYIQCKKVIIDRNFMDIFCFCNVQEDKKNELNKRINESHDYLKEHQTSIILMGQNRDVKVAEIDKLQQKIQVGSLVWSYYSILNDPGDIWFV